MWIFLFGRKLVSTLRFAIRDLLERLKRNSRNGSEDIINESRLPKITQEESKQSKVHDDVAKDIENASSSLNRSS